MTELETQILRVVALREEAQNAQERLSAAIMDLEAAFIRDGQARRTASPS